MGTRRIFLEMTFVTAALFFFAYGFINSVYAQWTAPTALPPNNNVTLNLGGGGAFEEVGSVIRQGGTPDYDEDFVFGSTQLNDDGVNQYKMYFNVAEGSFRAGRVTNSNWDDTSSGLYSVAFGYNTAASASYSSAFGYNSVATDMGAAAFGRQAQARGIYSFAAGGNTRANEDYTTAMGRYVYNDDAESFMVGFNTSAPSSHTTDPGFFVNTDNNVGIGTSAVDAGLRLDVAGRIGATEYCDEDGNNCTAAAALGGGGGGGIYGVIANQGLRIDGSNNFGLVNTCSNNQVLKWNGSSWACSADSEGSLGSSISSSEIENGTITYSDINTNSVQRRVSDYCGSGSSIRRIYSDGTVACETDDTGSSGDNLGNHSATQNLDMNGRDIIDVDDITADVLRIHGMYNPDASDIDFDADLNMSDNWILNARYRLNDCFSMSGGTGRVVCPNGYVMKGGDSDGDYFAPYCCRD